MPMKHLIRSNPWTNSAISRVLRVVSYTTGSGTLRPAATASQPDTLHLRVSRTGEPRASVVPVLNQWLEEGKPIKPSDLQSLIRKLRSFRRFHHALEISEWMREEMKRDTVSDVAVRLDLISKVRGVEEAEKYFHGLPDTMRTFQVYGALLNCYGHNKCLKKAEATMQTMRELGFPVNRISYNVLLNLYCRLGIHDKLDVLMQEMREKGIEFDPYTINIRLNAYALSSDIEGMEKFMASLEGDIKTSMDWHAYVVAANGYLKVGSSQKAIQMLNRAEQLVPSKARKNAYEVFMTLYANLGRKDDVYRIWKLYGSLGKFFNIGYVCVISSLIKLDDLDGAEKILAEWESGYNVFDGRIPRLMVSTYCKKGLIEKAEAYYKSLIERGLIVEPDPYILNSLAMGYHLNGMMEKAVEAMKKAILACTSGWKANTATLAACLKFLNGQNNIEAAEELLQLLRASGHFSTDVYDRLLVALRGGTLDATAIDQGDDANLDEEVQGVMEVKNEGSS